MNDEPASQASGRGRRVLGVAPLVISLAALAISLGSFFLLRHRLNLFAVEMTRRDDDLAWTAEVASNYSARDVIEPKVGTIQFLRRGFSIELERVNYSPAGLELQGFIGNPTNLWITQLTLDFWAYHRAMKDKFTATPWDDRWFFLPDSIGHAQSPTIPLLSPGERARFAVTIPNVAQTKDGFELTVSFSGERYSYGR